MDSLDKTKLHEAFLCPICNENSKIIDSVPTINPNSDDKVNLRECIKCKHWWIDPMPTQKYLSYLYSLGSEFVVSHNYKGKEEPSENEIRKYISRFLDLSKDISNLNYLEIGVGPGYLFNYFQNNVNKCYGVEPGGWGLKNSNIVSDIEFIPKNIKFDIIVIQDVLEHVEDPGNMLKKLNNLVNKGCIISCNFPNKDAFIAKYLKGRWRMVRPMGHVNYFSSKSIDLVFNITGWKVVRKYNYWSSNSLTDKIKKFDWHSRNPLKLSYRICRDLIFKELLLGRDQWVVIGTFLPG
ncbi:MAG: class I SAM-dependent methyltransferase [Actinobacteria bacterium]|nr:class I SAM-dependent methyltransferase [Actinomycetota bacterium]